MFVLDKTFKMIYVTIAYFTEIDESQLEVHFMVQRFTKVYRSIIRVILQFYFIGSFDKLASS